MNKNLTKALRHLVFFLSIFTVALVLAMPSLCFSEIYAAETAYAESEPGYEMSEKPVDVTLVKNGVEHEYTYFPVECNDFLEFAGVVLTEIDKVNVAGDVILYDNIMIDVSTVEYEEYTVEENLPYGYDLIEVDTIPKGTMNVITEGRNGVKNTTYISKKIDGQVVELDVIGEEIITQPVNGTAEYGVGGTVTASDGTVYNYSYRKVMEATAYTYIQGKTTMTTATGATLAKGIVAVDPKVIPLHTKMYIASDTFEYGYGSAEDTGGAIKGNIVDLAFMSYNECIQFGRRNMNVYILEE